MIAYLDHKKRGRLRVIFISLHKVVYNYAWFRKM